MKKVSHPNEIQNTKVYTKVKYLRAYDTIEEMWTDTFIYVLGTVLS